MAFLNSKAHTTTTKQNGARRVVMAAVLSTGVIGFGPAGAAGFEGGARVSAEGLDGSATFVSFDSAGGSLSALSVLAESGVPATPQDLSSLLAEVESVLGEPDSGPAIPVDDIQVQRFVAEAQALVGPILGAMGGGTLPDLTALSLESLPLGDFGAGGGGAPLALPGLEGLDAIQLGGALDDALDDPLGGSLSDGLGGGLGGSLPVGGVVDGVVGGVTGGLPAVPVVGGLLGQ